VPSPRRRRLRRPAHEIEKSDDPFEVLAYAASLGDAEARYVNAAFTAHEVEAITTAKPAPGAHDLIRTWSVTGRPLAIVSNNSTIAIHAYLDLHDLQPHVTHVSARTSPDPALLKPHPHLLTTALTALNVPAAAATFLGDSVTDIQAARAAPHHVHRLRQQTPQDSRTHDRQRGHSDPYTRHPLHTDHAIFDQAQNEPGPV
jgi:HAD superfamily hydrolase (TIGR01549 family)